MLRAMADAEKTEDADGEAVEASRETDAPTADAEEVALPGEGTEDGEKLRRAQQAFDAGDYKTTRALCREIAEARDGDVARHAHRLMTATAIDPVQVAILVSCLLFFMFVSWKYVLS